MNFNATFLKIRIEFDKAKKNFGYWEGMFLMPIILFELKHLRYT